MIQSLQILRDHAIRASDGALGGVSDLYVDDASWAVRYLVVDTGTWLPGRKVLIAASALGRPDAGRREVPVALTRAQVKDSPDIDTDKPVGRQHEIDLARFYGWAPYWETAPVLGPFPPAVEPAFPAPPVPPGDGPPAGDPHLRSGREIIGYAIGAEDGDLGRVDDLLVDDADWRVRYLRVDTGGWLSGRKVVLSTDWIDAIDWAARTVGVGLTRGQVEAAPAYDAVSGVDRAYEETLHRSYARTPYWGL
ncbi:PRC-barrel domain-containing protein [Azospirillum sp. ST 5-10]|uniref:PRC-barrel domain-containing protein n=1 Tax=unclassified Azospirillum TaxID=2630922 RepID=UPI003F49EC30